jgi:anti-sigma factor RsiW
MSCRTTPRLLSAALDGRLGAAERAALDAHLAACPGCRREGARWEAAARALRASGPTPLPPGLADRAWRAAMTAPARAAREAGFVLAARRALLAGALAAAAAWLAVLADAGSLPAPGAAAGAQDPLEVAMLLWTGEAGGHGE